MYNYTLNLIAVLQLPRFLLQSPGHPGPQTVGVVGSRVGTGHRSNSPAPLRATTSSPRTKMQHRQTNL